MNTPHIVAKAFDAARRGTVPPPVDGEPAGDPCPDCGAQPVYRLMADPPGYRIEHVAHGPHGKVKQEVLELQPPTRTYKYRIDGDDDE
jgi:hypothetical protein